MFKTKICELFGIEYPILSGGMVWIGKSDLAAAVSNAGGLGMLAAGGMTPEELPMEIDRVREMTDKPFGVNIPVANPNSGDHIKTCLDKRIKVVSTSAGSPKKYTGTLQDAGIKVMQVVPSPKLAEKAAAAGVDAIAAEGYEAGGHNGFEEITTMALIPQVVDAVDIPVVAAGGIADGRGLVAALALGAQGVQLGTRFAASMECPAHPRFKESLLTVQEVGTVITGRKFGPTRCVRNQLTEAIHEKEGQGATVEELLDFIGRGRARRASVDGEVEEGTVYCGQIAGLIKELKPVKEIMEGIMAEAKTELENLYRRNLA
jgi:enoyl-[acyl-carrier protein] reductase II